MGVLPPEDFGMRRTTETESCSGQQPRDSTTEKSSPTLVAARCCNFAHNAFHADTSCSKMACGEANLTPEHLTAISGLSSVSLKK